MGQRKKLPDGLRELFADPTMTFAGRVVKGDMTKIGLDFVCPALMQKVKVVDLATMARNRDAVPRATCSLAKLVSVVANKRLDKPPSVRFSSWSARTLSPEQQLYAALDVIAALDVYARLVVLDDLTVRLSEREALAGQIVSVVPPHGSVAAMATAAASATISEFTAPWTSPIAGSKPASLKPSPSRRLVLVTSVSATALIVPGVKRSDKQAITLGDFGPVPFYVALPMTMIAKVRVPTNIPTPTVEVPAMAAATPIANQTATAEKTAVVDAAIDDEADGGVAAVPEEEWGGGEAGADGPEEMEPLTLAEVELVRAATASTSAGASGGTDGGGGDGLAASSGHPHLDDAPSTITDRYRSVVGDALHFMDRPYVPVHHSDKKPYFVAMSEGWYMWDPVILAEVNSIITTLCCKTLVYFQC